MIILQVNVCTPCAEQMDNGREADFICWLDTKVGMCRACFARECFDQVEGKEMYQEHEDELPDDGWTDKLAMRGY